MEERKSFNCSKISQNFTNPQLIPELSALAEADG